MRMRLLLAVCIPVLVASVSRAQDQAKYLHPNVGTERRIDDLLRQMTVEEKISQIYEQGDK